MTATSSSRVPKDASDDSRVPKEASDNPDSRPRARGGSLTPFVVVLVLAPALVAAYVAARGATALPGSLAGVCIGLLHAATGIAAGRLLLGGDGRLLTSVFGLALLLRFGGFFAMIGLGSQLFSSFDLTFAAVAFAVPLTIAEGWHLSSRLVSDGAARRDTRDGEAQA